MSKVKSQKLRGGSSVAGAVFFEERGEGGALVGDEEDAFAAVGDEEGAERFDFAADVGGGGLGDAHRLEAQVADGVFAGEAEFFEVAAEGGVGGAGRGGGAQFAVDLVQAVAGGFDLVGAFQRREG